MILLAAVFGMSLAAPNPGYLYGLHGYGHSSHHYPSIHRVYLGHGYSGYHGGYHGGYGHYGSHGYGHSLW